MSAHERLAALRQEMIDDLCSHDFIEATAEREAAYYAKCREEHTAQVDALIAAARDALTAPRPTP